MKNAPIATLCLFSLSFFCVTLAGSSKYEVVNKNGIYYGNYSDFSRPACLSLKKVFYEIPEYRKILKKGLTREDPHYWLLLNAANEVFRNVVNGVAAENKYDLIGEQDSIRPESEKDSVPDVTHLALLYIRKLREK